MLEPDLIAKLQQRQTELAEVFVEETDAKKWPDDKTRDSRGDRYWHKRNAGATATLIVKIQSILDQALKQPIVGNPKEPTPGEDEDETVNAEAMAASAMREAKDIIDRTQGRFKKKK